MRRKPGTLLPIEIDILQAVAAAESEGGWIHGYGLAKRLADPDASGRLTAHGTLYKALGRLSEAGLLDNQWEDPTAAVTEGRPRRRQYRITGLGAQALADARRTDERTDGATGVALA